MASSGADRNNVAGSGMNVPDLGKMKRATPRDLSPEEIPDEVRADLERGFGMRCMGCGERITVGFEFVRVSASHVPGQGHVGRVETTYACSRAECDYAPKAAADSCAMRPLEWAYLDEAREGVSE